VDKKEIEWTLHNYHWMIKEIQRLREYLAEYGEGVAIKIDGLPKGKGKPGDPLFMEVARRERYAKRLTHLEKKVRYIQDRIDVITDDRERTVLDCLLDGLTVVEISHHMRLSRKHVHRIKEDIVRKMAEAVPVAN